VPVIFKKQHECSPKHKTCIGIIEKALERAKDIISSIDIDHDNMKSKQNVYFCEACAMSVEVNNKKEHEMSKCHFKSVMHDKLLRDLLMIYCDKDYLDEVDFEYMFNQLDNGSISNDIEQEIEQRNEYTDLFSDSDVEDIVALKSLTPQLTLQEYINMLNVSSNRVNSLTVEDENIKIVAADKSVIKVPEQHFHGFYNMNGYTVCATCQCVVNDIDGDVDGHKMSAGHIEKISEPILDMHCIRKVSF
jgi:hypothetical protein